MIRELENYTLFNDRILAGVRTICSWPISA